MNAIYTTISGLAAATVLLLSSCGDGNSTTDTPDDTPAPPPTASTAAYPLDVCVVSGEKLGSMGEPVVVNHNGTEVRFCCKECLPEFNKDPEKYVAMIKAGKLHLDQLIGSTISLEESLDMLVNLDRFAGKGVTVINEF